VGHVLEPVDVLPNPSQRGKQRLTCIAISRVNSILFGPVSLSFSTRPKRTFVKKNYKSSVQLKRTVVSLASTVALMSNTADLKLCVRLVVISINFSINITYTSGSTPSTKAIHGSLNQLKPITPLPPDQMNFELQTASPCLASSVPFP